ncbi:hypothetical protein D047_4672B, partial [Vibrio parahaemolyticus VPTS-2010_2]
SSALSSLAIAAIPILAV